MHSEALKPRDGFNYHSTEVSFLNKQDLKQFIMCNELIASDLLRGFAMKGERPYGMDSSQVRITLSYFLFNIDLFLSFDAFVAS